jgi:hypothetical protein
LIANLAARFDLTGSCCDFEAVSNALKKMFRPLNESREAAKGFRDFQPEHELDLRLRKGVKAG